MHWSLAGRCRSEPAAVVPADHHRAGRRRRCGVLRGGRAGHGGRRPQRRVRRLDPGVRRRRARPHRAAGHRRHRRRLPVSSRCWAGTFGPDLETELRRQCAMTVGHFPQSFDIATVGGWVACRGAGQYSTRYGKIEEMVVGLEVVLADGTVVRTGARSGGSDRARPHPAVPRQRGHARRDHAGVASGPSGAHPRTPRRLHVRRLRVGHRGVPTDPAPRRDAGGAAPVRRGRVATQPRRRRHAVRAAGARRGRHRARRGHHRRRRRRVRRGRDRRPTSSSSSGSPTATTRHALAGPDAQGVRRRHDGDRRAVVDAADDLRRGSRRR